MARHPRIVRTNLTQHVIQRGNNRVEIFRCASDYEIFLHALQEATLLHPIKIHNYVLMSNHVHLMVTPQSAEALAAAMQAVGRRYVPFFNDRYGRTGSLFEGRYKSFEIDSDHYWFTCARYVESNPVRAGLASTAAAYRWSSYSTYAFGIENLVISPHWLYLGLGGTPEERQSAWRGLCAGGVTDDQLTEIRASVKTGKPLGTAAAALGVCPANLESPRSGV
jgi:putative transposase